jgi:Ni,Fe-hydrogenase maturation factor
VGQKCTFTDNNIIAFEMNVKLQYKNCEMTLKKTDQVYIIDAVDITEKGYIVQFSETFVAKKKVYPNLLNFLNNVIDQDLNTVYKKLQNKKNLRDALDCNN